MTDQQSKHVAYVTTFCNKTVVLTYTIQHYITTFHLAFRNVRTLNTKAEHYPPHGDLQHSPFEATGFADEQYSSFITTPTSLPHVDLPIVGPLPERYKYGVYPLRYSFQIHFCGIVLSKHFFPKFFLPFRSPGRNLARISHIFFLLQALAIFLCCLPGDS